MDRVIQSMHRRNMVTVLGMIACIILQFSCRKLELKDMSSQSVSQTMHWDLAPKLDDVDKSIIYQMMVIDPVEKKPHYSHHYPMGRCMRPERIPFKAVSPFLGELPEENREPLAYQGKLGVEDLLVPVQDVQDGPDYYHHLLRIARNGGNRCVANGTSTSPTRMCETLIVVDLERTQNRRIEAILSCEAGSYACAPLAVQKGEQIWLRAHIASITEDTPRGCAQLSSDAFIPRVSELATALGRKDRTFIVENNINDVGQIIVNILESDPLKFNTSMQTRQRSLTIEATASSRKSPILVGWREIVTIRIEIDAVENKGTRRKNLKTEELEYVNQEHSAIDLVTTLYISKTNTTDHTEWHMPSIQQADIYVNELYSIINRGLALIAPRGIRRNANLQENSRKSHIR